MILFTLVERILWRLTFVMLRLIRGQMKQTYANSNPVWILDKPVCPIRHEGFRSDGQFIL